MPVIFSDSDIDYIIKAYTSTNAGIKSIGKTLGVGYKPVERILRENNIKIVSKRIIQFSKEDTDRIFKAYDSGIGYGGIPSHLSLDYSESAIKRLIISRDGKVRNRSEQQQARMDRCTFQEKQELCRAANKAARGSKVRKSSKIKKAKTIEGRITSHKERFIFNFLRENGFNPIPSKAIDIYNADLCIGNVTVEVFGGGWSFSDKSRIDRYLKRTKEIGNLGFHVVFLVVYDGMNIGDGSKLVSIINEFSRDKSSASKYRVIWGDRDGLSGLCSNIDHSAFVLPFKNIHDPVTGQYVSVRK